MIDVDLLKRENIQDIIDEFEREEMAFTSSGVLPVKSGTGVLFGWDIKAVARDIADFQGQDASAAPRKLTTIGHQRVTLARTFLSKRLDGRTFMDLRTPGSEARANAAQDQVVIDLKELDEDIDRQNEFMRARALQGQLDITIDGFPISINYQIPAATNIFTIGGAPAVNIAVPWSDASADIVDDVRRMKRAIQRGSGRPPREARISSEVAAAMIKNDTIKDFFRGTANASEVLKEGTLGRFMGINWIEVDTVFEDAAGALDNYLPENRVVMNPAPSTDWGYFQEGTDIIPNDNGDGMSEVAGRYGYSDMDKNPAAMTLFMGEVRLPVIRIPAAIVLATVLS